MNIHISIDPPSVRFYIYIHIVQYVFMYASIFNMFVHVIYAIFLCIDVYICVCVYINICK